MQRVPTVSSSTDVTRGSLNCIVAGVVVVVAETERKNLSAFQHNTMIYFKYVYLIHFHCRSHIALHLNLTEMISIERTSFKHLNLKDYICFIGSEMYLSIVIVSSVMKTIACKCRQELPVSRAHACASSPIHCWAKGVVHLRCDAFSRPVVERGCYCR